MSNPAPLQLDDATIDAIAERVVRILAERLVHAQFRRSPLPPFVEHNKLGNLSVEEFSFEFFTRLGDAIRSTSPYAGHSPAPQPERAA